MRWRDLVELMPGNGDRPPVVCFPPAGAAPMWLRPLAAALPTGTPVYAVQLAGHGTRLAEPPPTAMADAVGAAVAAVGRLGPTRCVLFGHSMGGVLAYETARRLPAPPLLLAVSGCRPPRRRGALPVRHTLDDDALVAAMVALGAPAEPFDEPEIRALALPVLRADLRLVETWRPTTAGPLDVPILVLAGDRDPDAPPADADGWAAETTAGCDVVTVDGDHYFVDSHAAEVAAALSRRALRAN